MRDESHIFGPAPEAEEKRRAQRLVPHGVSCTFGEVIDLSSEGLQLLVEGSSSKAPGSRINVVLRTDEVELPVLSRVAWRESLEGRREVLGIEFQEADPAVLDALTQIIQATCSGYSSTPSCYIAA